MKTTERSDANIWKSKCGFFSLQHFVVLLLVFSLHVNAAFAESQTGKIKGIITEKSTNSPLSYAQVTIYNQSDSSLLDGTMTNEKGYFEMNKIANIRCYLIVSFIGYKPFKVTDITIEGNVIDLGTIALEEVSAQIAEVTVVGKKESSVVKSDKKVLNVDKNLSAAGGSAIDALKISPSVTVNSEGNVLLRGSANFVVLVDGKPTALKANDALKQMPAGRIENIEIITNPSVKYDAEGTAGIINIITKKGLGAGISGLVDATVGTGDKYNANLNVNYTNDKLNVTLGAKWKDYMQFYNMDEIMQTTVNGQKRTNDILFYRKQTDKDFGGNIILDYNFNSKNSISYSADAGYTHFYVDANFKYNETIENQAGHKYVFEDVSASILANYFTNNLIFTHKFSEKSNWTNSLFYSKINYLMTNSQNRYNTGSEFKIDGIYPYYSMSYENDNFSTEFKAKSDYSAVDKSGGKFEAGAQYHNYKRYLDLNAESYDFGANNWVPDPVFSNEFDFNEHILSVYANYSNVFKGFNYSLGIREEYTNRKIESFTLNKIYKYDKLNHFSSLSVSKDLKNNIQLAFNYSNRIDRPDEYYLNPFPDISNEFQKAYGNPMLRPNLTDSYELSFRKLFDKGVFTSQLYLRSTNDAYTQVIGSDQNGIMILTFDNISDDKEYGVENMINLQALKWWSLNASLNVFGQNSKGEMNGSSFNRSAVTFDTRLINSFTLGKNTSAQVMAFYFHDRLGNAIGNVSRFYWIDASVQHNFLNNRLSVTLQAKDIFNTNHMKFDINRTDYRFFVHRKPEYPVVMLNVSYKFKNYNDNKKAIKTKLKIG